MSTFDSPRLQLPLMPPAMCRLPYAITLMRISASVEVTRLCHDEFAISLPVAALMGWVWVGEHRIINAHQRTSTRHQSGRIDHHGLVYHQFHHISLQPSNAA